MRGLGLLEEVRRQENRRARAGERAEERRRDPAARRGRGRSTARRGGARAGRGGAPWRSRRAARGRPTSVSTRSEARSSRRNVASSSPMRASAAPSTEGRTGALEREVLGHRVASCRDWAPGTRRRAAPRTARGSAGIEPVDGEAPGARRQQGRENPEERRLAAAVRAEEREDLAARHGERDVGERGARPEGAGEGAGFDGGRRHVRGAVVRSRQTRSRTRRTRIAGSHPIDARKRERARPSVISRANLERRREEKERQRRRPRTRRRIPPFPRGKAGG